MLVIPWCLCNAGKGGSHHPGSTAPHPSLRKSCGRPTRGRGQHPHPRYGPGHTTRATAHPTPRAPGETFFCKLTALTKLHKRRPPGSGSPRPTCRGSACTGGRRRRAPPGGGPAALGPHWPRRRAVVPWRLRGKVQDGLRLPLRNPRAGRPARPGRTGRDRAGPGARTRVHLPGGRRAGGVEAVGLRAGGGQWPAGRAGPGSAYRGGWRGGGGGRSEPHLLSLRRHHRRRRAGGRALGQRRQQGRGRGAPGPGG